MSARPVRPSPRRDAWERVTATPLAVLGLLFIVAYSVFVLAIDVDSWWHGVLVVALLVTWAVFLLDVVIRIALTPQGDRAWFTVTHPIDVLSGVVPLFRALRVLELLRQVPYLRRRTGDAVRARFVSFAAGYAVAFIYFLSLATLQAERDAPGANILTFGDAVWWACVTVATVGYGDMYPVTTIGRFYAVLLMIGGIAIVGTASATIISVLNERIARMRQQDSHGAPTQPAVGDELRPPRGLDHRSLLGDPADQPRPQTTREASDEPRDG